MGLENEDRVKPSIFVTDYGSYNEGRQFEFGHWVALDQFDDYEALLAYISAHFRECDKVSPLFSGVREELMITDYEGFPRSLYEETGNLEQIMGYLRIVKDSPLDAEVFEASLTYNGLDTIEELQELVEGSYQGTFDSDAEFAESFADQAGYLQEKVSWPYSCIDWDWAARELEFSSSDGHYFM